jgi:type IV pilus assembly protein PilC
MPLYSYTALDDLGRKLRGQMEASSEAALEAMLRREGRWVTEVGEKPAGARRITRGPGNRPVPRRALIEFFLQTGLQLRSGIALVEALRFGLEDVAHPGLRQVQANLVERVESGSPLSEALAAHPRTFAPLVVHLVRAGESSGRLAEVCAEIHLYYEWLDRLMADIRQALLYPAFVLVATLMFFVLVFTFLIPRFAEVLIEIKVKMPLLTRVFLGISKFMVAHGWAVAGVAILVIFILRFGPRLSTAFARGLDRFLLWMPIFGEMHHLICLSRVAQNLATLYRAGIPLLNALQLCRSLVGNRIVEDSMLTVEAGVNAGRAMHETMKQDSIFSRLMVQMVAVGETTGTLGESLQHVADYYNDIVPRQVRKLLAVMEPLLIIGLVVMVGTVALAVFLPIAAMFDAN